MACRGFTTETAAKQLSAPQKSAEGIVITASDEGPNGSRRAPGLKSKQVSDATHEREAAEEPASAGLYRDE